MKKRMISIYLAALMLLSLVPMTAFASGTSAWEAPTVQAYAEKADLSVFNLHASSESDHNYKKLQFGKYNGKAINWYIAGADSKHADLLGYELDGGSETPWRPFGLGAFNSDGRNFKPWKDSYGNYTDRTMLDTDEVGPNHYGASDIRAFLNNEALEGFSDAELEMIQMTTLTIADYLNKDNNGAYPSHYTVSDKLYLPNGDPKLEDPLYIYLGSDGSLKVPLPDYKDTSHPFYVPRSYIWLAAPYYKLIIEGQGGYPPLCASTYYRVQNVLLAHAIQQGSAFIGACPACSLDLNNLESGSFFSAAPAGISGAKEIQATAPAGSGGDPDFSAEDPFIMRLPDDGTFEDANITFDATVVRAEGAKKDATLVVQWSEDGKDYCYGRAIAEGASDEVTASDIAAAAGCASAVLSEDCKVWLEYTDTTSHITYAKLGLANFGKSLTTATVSAGKSPVYNGGVPVDPKDFGITVTLNDGTEVPDDGFELRFYLDENCTSAILDAGKPCAPTDAGIYFATAVGIEDEGYRGETETPAMVYVLKAALPKPVAVSGITYNGLEQTGVRLPDGADASRYIISGNKATEVGAYMANLALADPFDYCWAGESGDPRDDTISKPFTLNWEIKATAAELTKIKITKRPDKTTYTVGEAFDTTGMEVTAFYSDGSSKPVTGYTVTPSGALTAADTLVKITYTENGFTKTASQKIQVNDDPEPVKYEIIKGNDQTVFTNAKSAVFASNAPFDKFSHVLLDGKKLAKKYYKAESGSTVITLNENCIRKLSVGKHTLTIVSTDGRATAKFNVEKAKPKTGDSTNPALLLAIMIVCTGMTVLLSGKAKKRNS